MNHRAAVSLQATSDRGKLMEIHQTYFQWVTSCIRLEAWTASANRLETNDMPLIKLTALKAFTQSLSRSRRVQVFFCGPIIESIKISNIISLIKKTCGLIIFFCFFFSKLISFLVPRSKVSWWESLSDRVQTASDRNEKIAIFMLRTEQLWCWVEEQLWASISLLLRNNIPGSGSSPAGCEESSDD